MIARSRWRLKPASGWLAVFFLAGVSWGQSEGLRPFFNHFESLVLQGASLRPADVNAAFRTFYATYPEPDWTAIVATDLRDYLNQNGLAQLSGQAQLFKVSAPALRPVTGDSVDHALDPLKVPPALRDYFSALQKTLNAAGASVEDYGRAGRDISRFRLATYAASTASPVAAPVQLMHQTLRHNVLNLVTPAPRRRSDPNQPTRHIGLFGLKTTAGAEAFHSSSQLKGYDDNLETFGLTLNETVGDRFRLRAAVPIFRAATHGHDQLTFGGDLAADYAVGKGLTLGAHGNYLGHEGDFPSDHTWAFGPFVGYTFKLSDMYQWSAGALVDRIAPQWGQDTWVGAFAFNLGLSLREEMVLNAFYTYFRDFDAPSFAGADWHDVGSELVASFGKAGTLTLGAKTSLGYASFSSSWQVYAGIGWRF
jgi:hypothetical protein